jgi:RimJ/RimL family protein N-acetyltransferase
LPVLAAPPFHLRRFEDRDLAMVAEAAADPSIRLISTVPPPGDDAAARRYVGAQRHRLRDGFGYSFAIADPEDRGIGSIGLWLRDLDLGRASVGYWVVPAARGRGAAAAALGVLARWALRELAVARIELVVEPSNTASIRTAERAGFTREGRLRSWEVVGDERRDMDSFSLVTRDL